MREWSHTAAFTALHNHGSCSESDLPLSGVDEVLWTCYSRKCMGKKKINKKRQPVGVIFIRCNLLYSLATFVVLLVLS